MTTESHTTTGSAQSRAGVRDELKQDAGRLKEDAQARAKQEAETRKGQAVNVAGSATSALNTAAEELERNPDAPAWMASALQQAARKIDGMARHVDGKNVDDLGREVAHFAREHPGAFLAASAAAGFAAARLLRAGADKKRHAHEGENAGLSGQTGYAGMQAGTQPGSQAGSVGNRASGSMSIGQAGEGVAP